MFDVWQSDWPRRPWLQVWGLVIEWAKKSVTTKYSLLRSKEVKHRTHVGFGFERSSVCRQRQLQVYNVNVNKRNTVNSNDHLSNRLGCTRLHSAVLGWSMLRPRSHRMTYGQSLVATMNQSISLKWPLINILEHIYISNNTLKWQSIRVQFTVSI